MPVTKYVWDVTTDSYLMETDENDATTAVYTNGPGQFGPVISQRRGGDSHFFHHDGLGSVADVSDAAEDPTDSYVYKGYGEIVATAGSTVNPFRWVGSLGYFYDVDLLQYYMRARHYDPRSARWLSKDPIGYRARDASLYRYAKNSPLCSTDALGLREQGGWQNQPRIDALIRYRGEIYLKSVLLIDRVYKRERWGTAALRLRLRVRRTPEIPGYRDRWNRLGRDVPDEWDRETTGADAAGNDWLWPNLARLLRGGYGGWDPVKRVDNDYAQVVVRRFENGTPSADDPIQSSWWHTMGAKDGDVYHVAALREILLWPPCKRGRQQYKIWLVMCDTWGRPLYPGSPMEGPKDRLGEGERGGSTIAYYELDFKHFPRGVYWWTARTTTTGIPFTGIDQWWGTAEETRPDME